jgi:hypothetical protein
MEKFRYHNEALDEVALALGYINIYWAWLEHALDDFVIELAALEMGDMGRSVTANADLRSKIQMAIALAFIRRPSDDWFERTLATLNHVDNNLRIRRNNFVHGNWTRFKGRLTHRRFKTRLVRPQAFQRALSTQQETPIKIREVRKLCDEIVTSFGDVVVLLGYFMAYRDTEDAITFEQYNRQLKSNARRSKAKNRAAMNIKARSAK